MGTPYDQTGHDGAEYSSANVRTTDPPESKDVTDFKHLLLKGLQIKKYHPNFPDDGAACIIFTDKNFSTLFCGKSKSHDESEAYPFSEIKEVRASPLDTVITIVLSTNEGSSFELDVTSAKVKHYLLKMFNKFLSSKQRQAKDMSDFFNSINECLVPNDQSDQFDKGIKQIDNNEHDDDDKNVALNGDNETFSPSQVMLLGESTFTLSDEQVEKLVQCRIPVHTRWESYQEFKTKIHMRDTLIRNLQQSLELMNAERKKYMESCSKIEMNTQAELKEVRNHLATVLDSFRDLQRTSESREEQLRATFKENNNKVLELEKQKAEAYNKYQEQKEQISNLINETTILKQHLQKEQEVSNRAKDVEMSFNAQLQKLKEELKVEKELRYRAEMREEEERRERIAATAQLFASQTQSANQIKKYQDELQEEQDNFKETEASLKAQVMDLRNQLLTTNHRLVSLEAQLKTMKRLVEEGNDHGHNIETISQMSGEIELLKSQLEQSTNEKKQLQVEYQDKILHFDDLLEDKEREIRHSEIERRKLHNSLQELRGNIRVYARVRPFLPGDGIDANDNNLLPTINVSNDGISISITNPSTQNESQSFSFNKAFGPSVGQKEIFDDISDFIQSAIDGYNVCLFCYGQTGSGKTHTMQGSGTGPMRGIIPRALEQVGECRDKLQLQGWEFEMEVSYLEIYNEQIKDLLRDSNEDQDGLNYEIKRDQNGNIYVTNLLKINVDPSNKQQISELMELAAKQRSVGSTSMNEQSSRSHSVFTLYLQAKNESQNALLTSRLSLCDLAGSERLDRSQVTGDRLNETKAINKSLSCLTDVFVAIANKQPHIPFRNSKLTYLLSPAFSGDGKTLMLVALSPTNDSFFESLSSLRFANQVNQCELGKAVRNVGDLVSYDSKSDTTPSLTRRNSLSSSNPPPLKKRSPSTLSSSSPHPPPSFASSLSQYNSSNETVSRRTLTSNPKGKKK